MSKFESKESLRGNLCERTKREHLKTRSEKVNELSCQGTTPQGLVPRNTSVTRGNRS